MARTLRELPVTTTAYETATEHHEARTEYYPMQMEGETPADDQPRRSVFAIPDFVRRNPVITTLAIAAGATAAVFPPAALIAIFAGAGSSAAFAAAATIIGVAVTAGAYGALKAFDLFTNWLFSRPHRARYEQVPEFDYTPAPLSGQPPESVDHSYGAMRVLTPDDSELVRMDTHTTPTTYADMPRARFDVTSPEGQGVPQAPRSCRGHHRAASSSAATDWSATDETLTLRMPFSYASQGNFPTLFSETGSTDPQPTDNPAEQFGQKK